RRPGGAGAPTPRHEWSALRGADRHAGRRGGSFSRRRLVGAGPDGPPPENLGRASARLLARPPGGLSRGTPTATAGWARDPPPRAAQAHRGLRRAGKRALRSGDIRRGPRLPALALRERRRHRRTAHARRALRGRGRLSSPDAHRRSGRGTFVSSILDALAKLEPRRPPPPELPPGPTPPRRRRVIWLVGAIAGAGAALALTLLLTRSPSEVPNQPAPTPEPTIAPDAVAAPPASPPVAVPQPVADAQPV